METVTEKNIHKELGEKPLVFDYVDYRDFLKYSFDYLRAKNPSYSMTAFIMQAGFGVNSRGYFNLLISGKRNLSSKTILGFSKALKLNERQSYYFESLVHYNQANTESDKKYYFERLSKYIKGKHQAYEILRCQYNYFSQWYMVAIRELVSLNDFEYDSTWIAKKLRGRVSKKAISEALKDLLSLGLLEEKAGQLIQSNKLINFSDNSLNYTVVNNIHRQLLEGSITNLDEDSYEDRSASCVVIATDAKNFEAIREEIKAFRESIMNKYGLNNEKTNCVLNLGIQLNHLTQLTDKREREAL